MSKIARKPISISENIKVVLENQILKVGGPLGEMVVTVPGGLQIEIEKDKISVKKDALLKKDKPMLGTFIRLTQNAILGVSNGYEKYLEIVGTGYRGQMEGDTLVLSLGFSHPVKFSAPEGIKLSVAENKIRVFGVDKAKVGAVAFKIKMFRKPDAYKGKGIRYLGEKLRLKPGKAAAKVGGTAGK